MPPYVLLSRLRFHSIQEAVIFTAAIILGFAGMLLYPYAKRDFLNGKIERTRKALLAAGRRNNCWKEIPSKEEVTDRYPQVLTAMSMMSTQSIEHTISAELKQDLQARFAKWNHQKVAYSFVWMEIHRAENLKLVENPEGQFLSVYVTGKSVEYLKEKGTHSAMGNQTRSKKDFQDILIFTYLDHQWVLHRIIKDAWFWQM